MGLTQDFRQYDRLENEIERTAAADILTNFGWEVELTQKTKDGGYDIFGVSRNSPDGNFKSTYIVECKKYSQENKVGISVARELLQVKNEMKVSNALLITFSGSRHYT
jgi:HJR/Mrr/RecB family endonuclease